jgi:hypothetical protein
MTGDGVVIAAEVLTAAIVIALIWQGFSTWRARVDGRREAEYRRIATEATEVQRATMAKLTELTEGMTELRGRMAALEKLFREVG